MTVEAAAPRRSSRCWTPQRVAMRTRGFIVVAAAALLVAACTGSDDDAASDATSGSASVPSVVATTGIWADVVSNVGCDGSVSVAAIIPQGGDPHTFEPSLRDRETMDSADLVVANGLGLEERLEDTLEAVAAEGVHVFEVADHIDTIEFEFSAGHEGHDDEGGHDHDEDEGHEDSHDEDDEHDDGQGHDDEHEDEGQGHDDEHEDEGQGHDDEDEGHGHDDEHEDDGHDHSGGDPHVWFDPQRVASVLDELADELIEAGANADTVNRCLDAYLEALEDADAEIAEILAAIPADRRVLITNHDALGYFADHYGFEIVGTVIPSTSTGAETNPALLEELAEIIEHEGVPAVFSETTHSDDDIQALATAAGDIAVVPLLTGSLAPQGEDGDTLISMLKLNAHAIADALG